MDTLRSIAVSVIAASFVLAILGGILDEKGSAAALLRLIGGVFLMLTVLTPAAKLDFSGIEDYLERFSLDGTDIAAEGAASAGDEYRAIIKEKVEAYILDKAAAMGQSLSVEVILSDADTPVPEGVKLWGDVSACEKMRLQEMMETELAIAKENQIWIG